MNKQSIEFKFEEPKSLYFIDLKGTNLNSWNELNEVTNLTANEDNKNNKDNEKKKQVQFDIKDKVFENEDYKGRC